MYTEVRIGVVAKIFAQIEIWEIFDVLLVYGFCSETKRVS